MVAADQLLLGLGQVERQPVALGERADQEQQERQRLDEDAPAVVASCQSMIRSGSSEPAIRTMPRTDMPSGIS